MSAEELGCCGAYCRTCPVILEGACKGCKKGYRDGQRQIEKAKCAMKICCIGKGFVSCADCGLYETCETIRSFHARKGYKYGKYREALEFIRANGYNRFLRIADGWGAQYGKYGGPGEKP
jgi:hypothetical protein